MKKYLAQAAFKSSDSKIKYSMYIGRWQPWHQGHRWLIDQRLDDGKNVLICIRDIEPDEKNPWTSKEVEANLQIELKDLIKQGKVKIVIIPDIESINIGRGVGYDIIEHVPPEEIRDVSATNIRKQMKKDGKL
jgi:nicotinamide mononucleotide adenylyltransferase|tara:strand:- start:1798 stop:2196 length:399 start_codon:yes stop_codon:yes gene_type:complete